MDKFHYTYMISNIKENKHYIGCRSSTIYPEYDLGIKYFSSSKDKNFLNDQIENPNDYVYKIINIFEDRKSAINLEIELHRFFDVGVNNLFYNKSKQISTGFDTSGISMKDKRDYKKVVICPYCNKIGVETLMKQWHFENCINHPINGIENKIYLNGVSNRKSGVNNPMYGKYGINNPKSFKYILYDSANNIIEIVFGAEVKNLIKKYDVPTTFRYMTKPYKYTGNSNKKFEKFNGWYLETIKHGLSETK